MGTTTGRKYAIAALSVAGVLACAGAPTDTPAFRDVQYSLAKGGGGTAVTLSIVNTSPGLLAAGGPFAVTIPSGGVLDFRPACGSGTSVNLQGMSAAFDALGARSTCNGSGFTGFVFLRPLVNLSTPAGPCPDQDAPASSGGGGVNFGVTSRYFFQVDDADADTKFNNAQYTLVLTDCTVSIPAGQPTWRQVTATTGDLYTGQSATPTTIGVSVNVDLAIKP